MYIIHSSMTHWIIAILNSQYKCTLSPVITVQIWDVYSWWNTLSESLSSFFLHFVQLYYDFLLMLNDLVYDLYRTKPIKQKSTILLNTGSIIRSYRGLWCYICIYLVNNVFRLIGFLISWCSGNSEPFSFKVVYSEIQI